MVEEVEAAEQGPPNKKRRWWILGILGFVVVFSYLAGRKNTPSASEYEQQHPPEALSASQLKAFTDSVNRPTGPHQMTQEELEAKIRAELAAENAGKDRGMGGPRQENTTAEQEAQERRRKAEAALAASNVVVSFRHTGGSESAETGTNPGATTQQPEQPKTAAEEAKEKYPWNAATGKTHLVFEGTILPCTIMNRLNGSFAGPVNCQVSMDVFSHNHEHVLIPQGSVLTGDVSAVNDINQERLMVTFHRIIMPDGYSWDMDRFPGLDQQGATALKDKVNHHLVPAFAAALAIGAISGLAQIGSGYSGYGYDPGVAMRNGFSQAMGQEAMQILQRFLTRLPTIIIREGQRARLYVIKDMTLPEYGNHDVDGDL